MTTSDDHVQSQRCELEVIAFDYVQYGPIVGPLLTYPRPLLPRSTHSSRLFLAAKPSMRILRGFDASELPMSASFGRFKMSVPRFAVSCWSEMVYT